MFSQLTDRVAGVIKNISGQGKLTESNIQDAIREVRVALLEADVAMEVIKPFLENIKQEAMGEKVLVSLNPSQVFIKIVNDELIKLMGDVNETLNLNAQPPVVMLMAGLQGSGKTTTVGKLAKFLKDNQKKTVMVASCDVYRPAAIHQLQILANQIDVKFFESHAHQKPVDIAKEAVIAARKAVVDVLLIDTAGRMHIDADMMDEIKHIHSAVNPTETLFVVDSMTGQDAAKTAKAFDEALPLTGVILTKTDGDARGGAALSIRYLTGKPIKFLGVGEKIDALSPFYPDRIASRILGMGDILSLVEQAHEKIDKKDAERIAKKMQKGHFDLEDYRDQLAQMSKMGGVASLLDKLPGMSGLPGELKDKVNDKTFTQVTAIINSMTPKERKYPDLIRGGRKIRIAKGSGTQIQEVNKVLKQFYMMQKMMKKMGNKAGMFKMMRNLKNMMPGGFPGIE
ncbi:MAG TPA: signal recognition particle protein [Gammaproteobacteria bacterium]|nr:signal recognition particle protein [Gammaproteobacteria bacterium]